MKVLRLNIIYTNQKMYNVNVTNIILPGKMARLQLLPTIIMSWPLFQVVK